MSVNQRGINARAADSEERAALIGWYRDGHDARIPVLSTVRVPNNHPASSGSMLVLVEGPAESVVALDGDERDNEFGHGTTCAVDEAAEVVGGNRDGQASYRGQGDAAGGVPEDEPFLLGARNRLCRADRRLRAVIGGCSSRTVWTSAGVISRRLATQLAQAVSTGESAL